MKEEWVQLKDFPNYLISNTGKVFNKKLRKDKDGYLTVSLYKNNKETNCKVHRLVGTYFVDGYFEGAIINHKDENKSNNNYWNLEWCTVEYNNKYNNKDQRINKKIDMFDLHNNYIKTFKSLKEASEYFNRSCGNLSSHLKGKQKTFANHIFKYHFN